MSQPNFASGTIWTQDNLNVLRGINSECIDLIYLDPPFNSNRNYSAPVGSKAAGAHFKDAWTLDDVDEAWIGLLADKTPAIAALLEATGVIHGKSMQSYLTYMAVRLLEMRRVLKPTGSIYLHCDSTATHQLKLLMDAVFEPQNYGNSIAWCYAPKGGQPKRQFKRKHDTVHYYANNLASATFNSQWTAMTPETLRAYNKVDEDGRRYHLRVKGNVRTYLDENPGRAVPDWWTDIAPVAGHEKTGYPTQKPLALLERIIKASSDEGDVVLDPFCGTATTCVAAEQLRRQWVGIDLSPKAAQLANERLYDLLGDLWHPLVVTERIDVPSRTDLGKLPPPSTHKHGLYGQQEGKCAGCALHFPFQNLTIDHKVPRKHGGGDELKNLELLCGHCNSIKGERDKAYLLSRLKELRIL